MRWRDKIGNVSALSLMAVMGSFFWLVLFLVLLFQGCEKHHPPKPLSALEIIPPLEAVPPGERYNLSVVTTKGNHSYIPLNRDGLPSKYVNEILGVVSAFENAHPELEVVSFAVDQQAVGNVCDSVYGLWLHHRPKR